MVKCETLHFKASNLQIYRGDVNSIFDVPKLYKFFCNEKRAKCLISCSVVIIPGAFVVGRELQLFAHTKRVN